MFGLQVYGTPGTCRRMTARFVLLAVLAVTVWVQAGKAQAGKDSGSLRGQVTDPSGAVVAGASVSATTSDGQVQKTVSDKLGNYVLHGLPEGNLTLSVTAPGFAAYQMPNVIISAGETQQLDVALGIAVKQEQVTVQSEGLGTTVDINPANNASATILKGEDLEALPDDPDLLQQDLLALAGPSVGPNGGQIYIDGFSDGTLPPKSSIREIRINQNPFSAEYDKPGYGRIEVFTKPGSDKWHGQGLFNENNSVFNSRNPYVQDGVPPYHSEIYRGNVSGALSRKLSIFLSAEQREMTELDAVAETIAGPSQAVSSPRSRTNVSTRLDYQVTPGNTLTARYQFERNDQQNLGIGGLVLASQGYSSSEIEHTLQISDTQVVSPHVVNETRFQFIRQDTSQSANQPGAAINVLGEFTAGGNTVGQSSDILNRFELQNFTSWVAGKHFVKFGGRLRAYHDTSLATANFNGTLTYSSTGTPGRPGAVCPPDCTPIQTYGNGTPLQLSIVNLVPGQSPRILVNYADVGLYAEDDWKLRPNLTLSYGLRFESQSSIHDHADFAPRVGVSWGLGSSKSTPKTVLRLGYGIFYDRFTEDLVLQTERLNGEIEQQTIYTGLITCPAGTIPPSTILASSCNTTSATSSLTLYQINSNLRAPYTLQSAVSLERQLGSIGTVSLTYLNSRGLHQFILENVNAPHDPAAPETSRPFFPNVDNIYQYNSEAIFKQNQLITNVNIRVSHKISLIGYYALSFANSNTSGPSSSPSNQYNLNQDYGRASFDVRHRIFLSGTASLAHNIRISPFVLIYSGAPFNIITGQDNNLDSFFNDRPAFGPPCTAPLADGCFNVNPTPGELPIPINSGNGNANVTVNVRLSKTFGFGPDMRAGNAAPDQGPGGADHGGGGGHGGGGHGGGGYGSPRGMGGIFAPSTTTRRYNLTLNMMARNIFNTWNPGLPVGNLSSSMFGKTNSLAGGPFSYGTTANRRVDFEAIFSF